MSYPISLTFYTTAGLNDLRAQLYDSTGTNSGAAISTGFIERGTNGMYNWFGVAGDGFVGGVEIYSLADASNILAIRDINPREVENSDVKVSSLEITTAVMQVIADVINARSVSHVEDTAERYSQAEVTLLLLKSRQTAADTQTIYKTDGVTVFGTREIETDDTAKPIVGVS